jgi:hypothetical protein
VAKSEVEHIIERLAALKPPRNTIFITSSAMPVKNIQASLNRDILEIAQLLRQCQQTPDATIPPAKFSFGASVPGA